MAWGPGSEEHYAKRNQSLKSIRFANLIWVINLIAAFIRLQRRIDLKCSIAALIWIAASIWLQHRFESQRRFDCSVDFDSQRQRRFNSRRRFNSLRRFDSQRRFNSLRQFDLQRWFKSWLRETTCLWSRAQSTNHAPGVLQTCKISLTTHSQSFTLLTKCRLLMSRKTNRVSDVTVKIRRESFAVILPFCRPFLLVQLNKSDPYFDLFAEHFRWQICSCPRQKIISPLAHHFAMKDVAE